MLISEDWITAQQAVIGSMLSDCKAIPLAMNKCQSADFTPPQQILFDTIRQMFVSRGGIEGIDPVSILAAVPDMLFYDLHVILRPSYLPAVGAKLLVLPWGTLGFHPKTEYPYAIMIFRQASPWLHRLL